MARNQDFGDAATDNKNGPILNEDAASLIAQGKQLQRIETPHTTAIAVSKPRNLDLVVSAVLKEAKYAADKFYYSWEVTDKRTGEVKTIQGGSYHLAICLLREWGNSALFPSQIEETADKWVFYADAVDLERGFTVRRAFRKMKPKEAPSKYDLERWEDMQFQVGQSKALRNAAFGLVPNWLVEQAVDAAKDAAAEEARKGLPSAIKRATDWFGQRGISPAQLSKKLNRENTTAWTPEDIAILSGFKRRILDGEDTAQTIFELEPTTPDGKVTAKDLLQKQKETKLESKKTAGERAAQNPSATGNAGAAPGPPSPAPKQESLAQEETKHAAPPLTDADKPALIGMAKAIYQEYEKVGGRYRLEVVARRQGISTGKLEDGGIKELQAFIAYIDRAIKSKQQPQGTS